ncbi:hypothetical protein CJD35_18995 (plasmid) [Sphingobium xenophagum]|jgi:hypothetical protein|uniref:PD(D/E)XK endonuclease domain-containing protein n=1 Tax=Sphingobium xenophagum TaxID=121428 RepID=A0A249MZ14_SPHXE|nr:hypothetical protein [Sphingobium xenophagum]ASY46568.1 hypothetical protein CJD35_18995 [Sphingobium xenophagum]
MQAWIAALSTYSATRETILQHRFLADVGGELWRRGEFDFSVSHSEVDNSGYDLIIEARGIMRHVQLKAMHGQARRRSFDIQTRLGAKPNGCAVLIRHDARSLAVEAYRWFGAPPGQGLPPLGEKVTRHAKGNALGHKADRPALREVPLARFAPVSDIAALVVLMFGPWPEAG